jgi:glycine cleavage system aminomethyltransferase T
MASLEDLLRQRGNPARMMQNAQTGRYAFPVPSEFTHWIEEQRAWRESAALMEQSYHMTDLYVKGDHARRCGFAVARRQTDAGTIRSGGAADGWRETDRGRSALVRPVA